MAPAMLNDFDASSLSARQYYNRCGSGSHYSNGRCYTSWSWYGRWILAAVLIGLCVVFFFLWACLKSRRRRRQGMRPMYGTGWMAGGGNPPPPNAQYYNNNNNQPPPYAPPPGQSYPMNPQATGNTFQTGDGYYGQHEGIQQPKNAYAPAGGNDYAPPPGPPPNSRP